MIEKLQRIARVIQIFRLPSISVGLISLVSIVAIIFISDSHEGDRLLIPSLVSLLWAMSTYAFIVTFRSVPQKANQTTRFFFKLIQNIKRGWYWFISLVFLATSVTVIVLTIRMVSIWSRDYGG